MNIPKRSSNEASPSLPQARPERDLAFERLIFFSDAVFAIAITLLALDIRLPTLSPNATDAQVLNQLLALSPKYYSFGLSFLAIGLYWLGHHRMFHSIARFDPQVGRGYTFTTRTFPHWDHSLKHWTRSEYKDSNFCSKYLSGGTILVNCLEYERTVSMMKGEEENLHAHKP